jgi:hypothetical protein
MIYRHVVTTKALSAGPRRLAYTLFLLLLYKDNGIGSVQGTGVKRLTIRMSCPNFNVVLPPFLFGNVLMSGDLPVMSQEKRYPRTSCDFV